MQCGHSCPCSSNIETNTSCRNGHTHHQVSSSASSRWQDLAANSVRTQGNGNHATSYMKPAPGYTPVQCEDPEATRAVEVHVVRFPFSAGHIILKVESCRFEASQGSHHSVKITLTSKELEELVVLQMQLPGYVYLCPHTHTLSLSLSLSLALALALFLGLPKPRPSPCSGFQTMPQAGLLG